MKTMRTAVLIATVGVLLAGTSPPGLAAEKGYKVIVHSSNSAASLTREQLGRYFLKKATSWPGGKTVAPVDQVKGSPVRESFSRDAVGKSVVEVASYWQQQIFSGRSVPPPEKRNDAEVVAFVESNEGAIGYVSEGAAVGDAKVIRVD
jgi:ABC-type phosphate transport system substrate-binding protein